MVDRSKFYQLNDVSIFDLHLDPFNPRIRHGIDQHDCISRIADDRDQFLALMKDIAANGLSPKHILLSKAEDGKFIVRDGNRRVTALKLLNRPDLCLPDEALRNLVFRIAGSAKAAIVYKLDCLVCEDEATVIDYLRREHTGQNGGIGQVDWSALLIALFNAHAGIVDQNRRAAQLILWMEARGKHVANDFPITTLTRLLSAQTLAILGFSVRDDNIAADLPEAYAYAIASRVLDDISANIVNVTRGGVAGSIYSLDSALEYVRRIRRELGPVEESQPTGQDAGSGGGDSTDDGGQAGSGGDKPDARQGGGVGGGGGSAAEASGGQSNGGTGDEGVAGSGQSADTSQSASKDDGAKTSVKPGWDRPCLFGRRKNSRSNIPIPTDRRKAETIVGELRSLNPFEHPMAVTMLLRALLELSDKEYRKACGLRDLGALHKNIGSSADRMLTDGLLTATEHHVVLAYSRSEESFNHIRAIQKYIHDDIYHPNGQSLNTIWDSIGCFVTACWVGVTRAAT